MDAYNKLRPFTGIDACECASVEGVFLVDLLTDNPLHCDSCRREVDPERLKLTTEETEAVARWLSTADALYRLWLDSGEYEEYARNGTSYFEFHPRELPKTNACWLPGSLFLRDAAFDFFVECFQRASASFDYFSFVRFGSNEIRRLIEELTIYLDSLKSAPTREQLFANYASIFTDDIWSGVPTQPLSEAVLNTGRTLRRFVRSNTKESACLWILGM